MRKLNPTPLVRERFLLPSELADLRVPTRGNGKLPSGSTSTHGAPGSAAHYVEALVHDGIAHARSGILTPLVRERLLLPVELTGQRVATRGNGNFLQDLLEHMEHRGQQPTT